MNDKLQNHGQEDEPTTPGVPNEIEQLIRDTKSEYSTYVDPGSGSSDSSPADALMRWIAKDDDQRSESWVSPKQAKAMAIMLEPEAFFGEDAEKLQIYQAMPAVIDNLLHLQVSINGRGRVQQAEVLGSVMAQIRRKDTESTKGDTVGTIGGNDE